MLPSLTVSATAPYNGAMRTHPHARRAQNGLTSADAAAALGLPYRTLMGWVESGLLEPELAPGPYRDGHKRPARVWAEKNLREAAVLIRLRRALVPLRQIRAAMEHLRACGQNPFSTGKFLVMGNPRRPGSVIKVCDSGELRDLIALGQFVLPLDEEPQTERRGQRGR